MIAVETLHRYRRHKKGFIYLEHTQPGGRCDWVTEDHVYFQLGMANK